MNREEAHQQNVRIEKWRELLVNDFGKDMKLLKKRLRKGVPPGMRQAVWPKLVKLDAYRHKHNFTYEQLLQKQSPCEREIGLDIDRTSADQNPEILRKSLRKVLHALSLMHPSIGYCQGMNTLAMRMLETLDDQTSFWMVSYLISLFPLLRMNLRNPRSTELQNHILERLVEKYIPAAYAVLKKQQVFFMSFAPRWFLTLLTATLPKQTLFRVFDCMLMEGYKIVFRACLALIKIKQKFILTNTYEANQKHLSGPSELHKDISPDAFVDLMFSFSISRQRIGGWETEFLQKNPGYLDKLQKQSKENEKARAEDILRRKKLAQENQKKKAIEEIKKPLTPPPLPPKPPGSGTKQQNLLVSNNWNTVGFSNVSGNSDSRDGSVDRSERALTPRRPTKEIRGSQHNQSYQYQLPRTPNPLIRQQDVHTYNTPQHHEYRQYQTYQIEAPRQIPPLPQHFQKIAPYKTSQVVQHIPVHLPQIPQPTQHTHPSIQQPLSQYFTQPYIQPPMSHPYNPYQPYQTITPNNYKSIFTTKVDSSVEQEILLEDPQVQHPYQLPNTRSNHRLY